MSKARNNLILILILLGVGGGFVYLGGMNQGVDEPSTSTTEPQKVDTAATTTAPSSSAAQVADTAPTEDLSKAAAIVNGREIPLSKIDEQIQRQPGAEMMLAMGKNNPDFLNRMRRSIVDRMIERELLLDEAKRKNIEADPAELANVTKEMTGRFGSHEGLEEKLGQMGLNMDTFKEQLKDDLRIRAYIEELTKTVPPVSEEDTLAEFNKNPDQYGQPEQLKARHILIKVDPGATPEQWAEAEKKITEIHAKLSADGANFEELAKANSQDSTASIGGNLGFFPRGRMVPEFETAAFNLKDGEISTPVKTQFGYHIIKAEERKIAEAATYDKVKLTVTDNLTRQRTTDTIRNTLTQLKDDAKVEIKIPEPQNEPSAFPGVPAGGSTQK